ncbi:hypothetical protein KSP39_PZI020887 [Platanthera zijinensis]|uniref:AB hydrolase-1 domain-containing protein n=1 Tax=Platanthera zijinensis TaxID=2320716 RepID=A0AAP0FXD2_9ASPA
MNPFFLSLYAWHESTTLHVTFRKVEIDDIKDHKQHNGSGEELLSLQDLATTDISARTQHKITGFLLHSALNSYWNSRSFCASLAPSSRQLDSSPVLMVTYLVRNTGRNLIRVLEPPHDMTNAAKDLANLVKFQEWEWPDVVIGHSMGGKVALDFAASCARGDYGESAVLPKQVFYLLSFAYNCHLNVNHLIFEQLWVLDSVPGEVSPDEGDGEVEKVLHTLTSLPSSLPSRKWLVDHMIGLGFSKSLSEWMGSNLKKSGDEVTWTFELHAAIEMFNSYRETSYWHILEQPPKGMEIEVVRAENSDRWQKPVLEKLAYLSTKERRAEEGKVRLHLLPKSGHWVHADNPMGLLEIMVPNFVTKA